MGQSKKFEELDTNLAWLEQLYLRIESDIDSLIEAEVAKKSYLNPHHLRRLAALKGRIRSVKKLNNADW